MVAIDSARLAFPSSLPSTDTVQPTPSQKVASAVESRTFRTQGEASDFLAAHKNGGGYGYIDPYGSDRIGWEVRHWTD